MKGLKAFSSQSDIFGKIAIIQQSRNVNLKEVFCYPLWPVPWSIAFGSGDMIKTSKSVPMTELEKGATDADQVPRPFAVIIDGMAMVRKVRNKGVTFDEFADELLKYALTSSSDARRIDIVFDVYRETSLKNAERGHRKVGRLHFKKIIGNQYIKHQWESFLSSGENKTELIRFLVSRSMFHMILFV